MRLKNCLIAVVLSLPSTVCLAKIAQISLAPDGTLIYRAGNTSYGGEADEAFFETDYAKGTPKSFQVKRLGGVLVLSSFDQSSFDTWETHVPLGTIDAVTGKVTLFEGVRFTAQGPNPVFSSAGDHYPQLNPSLKTVSTGPTRMNQFLRALGSALVEKAVSRKAYDEFDAVGASFVDEYMEWRTRLSETERAQFDRIVLKRFAEGNFKALYRSGLPIPKPTFALLKLASDAGLLVELTATERDAAKSVYADLTNVTKGNPLDRMKTETFVEQKATELSRIRSAIEQAVDIPAGVAPTFKVGRKINCPGLGEAVAGEGL